MHDDLFVGACAASDLTARLSAEVARAKTELDAAERRFNDAAAMTPDILRTVPFGLRRDVSASRRRLAALLQVLDGVIGPNGGPHAASA